MAILAQVPPPSEAELVSIDSVVVERACYPRTIMEKTGEPYYLMAHRYYLALKSGAQFPPIVLTRMKGKNILVDGYNRVIAHKKLKKTEIMAEFIICKNYNEVLLEAMRRNAIHGQPLSPFEVKSVCLILTKNKAYSLADIARTIAVPLDTLTNWMKRDVQTVQNGREIVTKVMLRNVSVKHMESGEQKHLAARSQIVLIGQLISLLENDLIDINNKDVINGLERLAKLLYAFHMPT